MISSSPDNQLDIQYIFSMKVIEKHYMIVLASRLHFKKIYATVNV